jgi:shikimate kinase
MRTIEAIRLIGPGGGGKSTVGALLAERLGIDFLDLDGHFASQFGDISAYIHLNGYDSYARANVEAFCSLQRGDSCPGVQALSSGFVTYPDDVHGDYLRVRHDIEVHPNTFVLLPSLDREVCVAEIVRRQIARPFARPAEREEAVICSRFETYMALSARKIETMGPLREVVDKIASHLRLGYARRSETQRFTTLRRQFGPGPL